MKQQPQAGDYAKCVLDILIPEVILESMSIAINSAKWKREASSYFPALRR
jgi:hypothetical protein